MKFSELVEKMNQSFFGQEINNAVYEIEEILKMDGFSVQACLDEVSKKYHIEEPELRKYFSVINDMSVEDCYNEIHNEIENDRIDNSIESIKRELDKRISEVDLPETFKYESIFDVPNPDNLPMNPRITGDEEVDYSEKLKLASRWLKNVITNSDSNPYELASRVAAAFNIDDQDLQLEFESDNNIEFIKFYRSIWSNSDVCRIENSDFGRTRYVYRHNGSSTTYYSSKFQTQSESWQKLEQMVKEALNSDV